MLRITSPQQPILKKHVATKSESLNWIIVFYHGEMVAKGARTLIDLRKNDNREIEEGLMQFQ